MVLKPLQCRKCREVRQVCGRRDRALATIVLSLDPSLLYLLMILRSGGVWKN